MFSISTLSHPLSHKQAYTHVLRRIIGAPANKRNLVAGALPAVQLILDVVDGVAAAHALLAAAVFALGAEQLFAEDAPVGFLGRLLDDDFFPVVADLVDDVFDVFAQLELVERANAFGVDGDTAGGGC